MAWEGGGGYILGVGALSATSIEFCVVVVASKVHNCCKTNENTIFSQYVG